MKKILILIYVFLVTGCQEQNSKSYFICEHDVFNDKTLLVDIKNKYFKIDSEMVYLGFEDNDLTIKVDEYTLIDLTRSQEPLIKYEYEFNVLNGELKVSFFNYDTVSKRYRYSSENTWLCKESEPMI